MLSTHTYFYHHCWLTHNFITIIKSVVLCLLLILTHRLLVFYYYYYHYYYWLVLQFFSSFWTWTNLLDTIMWRSAVTIYRRLRMAISINPKPAIYRNLYENTAQDFTLWWMSKSRQVTQKCILYIYLNHFCISSKVISPRKTTLMQRFNVAPRSQRGIM